MAKNISVRHKAGKDITAEELVNLVLRAYIHAARDETGNVTEYLLTDEDYRELYMKFKSQPQDFIWLHSNPIDWPEQWKIHGVLMVNQTRRDHKGDDSFAR
jgi:hypothetical protein